MGRVIAIQEGSSGFVWSVNIVVGTNASKMFGTLLLFVESKDENNIEQ